jgi:hypothetical protein
VPEYQFKMRRLTGLFHRRVYYGWWVTLACAGIGFFTGGIAMYGRTVFVNPIVNEFGWTYVQFSVAILISGKLTLRIYCQTPVSIRLAHGQRQS